MEPLAKQASVLASESELTGVSLASHAARVASFVHCRTRGCEAIFSNLFVLAFFFCLPPFRSSLSLRDRSDQCLLITPQLAEGRRVIRLILSRLLSRTHVPLYFW